MPLAKFLIPSVSFAQRRHCCVMSPVMKRAGTTSPLAFDLKLWHRHSPFCDPGNSALFTMLSKASCASTTHPIREAHTQCYGGLLYVHTVLFCSTFPAVYMIPRARIGATPPRCATLLTPRFGLFCCLSSAFLDALPLPLDVHSLSSSLMLSC